VIASHFQRLGVASSLFPRMLFGSSGSMCSFPTPFDFFRRW